LSFGIQSLTAQERHNIVAQLPPDGYGAHQSPCFLSRHSISFSFACIRVSCKLPGAVALVSKLPFHPKFIQELDQHMPWETKDLCCNVLRLMIGTCFLEVLHNKMSRLGTCLSRCQVVSHPWGVRCPFFQSTVNPCFVCNGSRIQTIGFLIRT